MEHHAVKVASHSPTRVGLVINHFGYGWYHASMVGKNMMSSKSLLFDKSSVMFHAPSPVLSERNAL